MEALWILAAYFVGTAYAMVVSPTRKGDAPSADAAQGRSTTDDHLRVAIPTSTAEEDRHTAGQRRVNMVWEFTQAFIAVALTAAYIGAQMMAVESESLNNSFFLVVGFYFGRTNHQRVGGVTGGGAAGATGGR